MSGCNSTLQMSEFEIQNKCRVCLSRNGKVLLFTIFGRTLINIRQIFEMYTGIKVVEEDNMPKCLCDKCFRSLLATHKFITQCKTADSVLQSLEVVLSLKQPSCKIECTDEIKFEIDENEYSQTLNNAILENSLGDERIQITSSNLIGRDLTNENYILPAQGNEKNVENTEIKITDELLPKLACEVLYSDIKFEKGEDEEETRIYIDVSPVKSKIPKESLTVNKKIDASERIGKSKVRKKTVYEEKKHVCNICSKTFSHRRQLKEHSHIHTKERPYCCAKCSATFSFYSNLRRHRLVHTGERPYKCDVCGKGFTQSTGLKFHKNRHIKNANGNGKQRKPKNRKNTTLPMVQQTLCSYCGRFFHTNRQFVHHLTTEHCSTTELKQEITQILKYYCTICYRHFGSEDLVNNHIAVHNKAKDCLCGYCGKQFRSLTTFNSHTALHTGERPYKCELCGKTFSQIGGLVMHKYIHSDIKRYQCHTCDKAFRMSHQLTYHLRIHTGERPYPCKYCGKTFRVTSGLTAHIRTHTGETPYYCPYCNRGFNSSNNMKKHLAVHGNKKKNMKTSKELEENG